ncbi:unnamed protein product [Effrenium voratum]|uniref:Phospholipase/carboxylesterase/thioesterase domain-containing protein n=1 Tax=Effrenium voratum TaxID=2562239 RepID=A0AA36J520_9DINO|nr:unnamed protein product [Effrenium voratum]CAJ1440016.1 unnamed protein product [Effrenium voratum]
MAHRKARAAQYLAAGFLLASFSWAPSTFVSGPRRPERCRRSATSALVPDDAEVVLEDAEVEAAAGHQHCCTMVYLHGFSRCGPEYLPKGRLGFCMPWVPGGDRARGLRAVLPTASCLRQPWGETGTSWYGYAAPNHNRVGDAESLRATRRRLDSMVHAEVERLGDGRRLFLGGASQGCVMALDVYIRLAVELRLGGFVGSVGFVPTDSKGFTGADRALRCLLADSEQAVRPLWLQCAMDDFDAVPWRSVVAPSLRRAEGLPGLQIRQVAGRGHGIEDWEAHIVNDLLRAHAAYAYA